VAALRISQEVQVVRDWIGGRGGWPCRRLDGGLAVGFHGDICRGLGIGWDEFEVNFRVGRYALAFDEAAGSTRCYLGGLAEAVRFAEEGPGWTAPASLLRAGVAVR